MEICHSPLHADWIIYVAFNIWRGPLLLNYAQAVTALFGLISYAINRTFIKSYLSLEKEKESVIVNFCDLVRCFLKVNLLALSFLFL